MNEFTFTYDLLIWPLLTFLSVMGIIPWVRGWARDIGLVDKPNSRKVHDGLIPLIGGIVVFPVFMISLLIAGFPIEKHWALFLAITIMLITGVIDDRHEIRSWIKFAIQFVAAFLIVVPGGAQVFQLGNLFGFGDVGLDFMSLPFSIIAVVLLINAINLMDGLDGLSGGTVFIILGWFLYAAYGGGTEGQFVSIMMLMGAIAGFLTFNMRGPFRRRASVFMGDAGSLSMGLMVAWYAITLSPEHARVIEPISVAWVLAIPIWDECAQFYRRVKEGRHPFSPDKGHFHHHFLKAGFTPRAGARSVLIIVFLGGLIGVFGAQFLHVPLPVLTVVWIIGILGHMTLSRNLEIYPTFIKRFFKVDIENNS